MPTQSPLLVPGGYRKIAGATYPGAVFDHEVGPRVALTNVPVTNQFNRFSHAPDASGVVTFVGKRFTGSVLDLSTNGPNGASPIKSWRFIDCEFAAGVTVGFTVPHASFSYCRATPGFGGSWQSLDMDNCIAVTTSARPFGFMRADMVTGSAVGQTHATPTRVRRSIFRVTGPSRPDDHTEAMQFRGGKDIVVEDCRLEIASTYPQDGTITGLIFLEADLNGGGRPADVTFRRNTLIGGSLFSMMTISADNVSLLDNRLSDPMKPRGGDIAAMTPPVINFQAPATVPFTTTGNRWLADGSPVPTWF